MKLLILQDPLDPAPVERWVLDAAPDTEVRIITTRDSVRRAADVAPGTRRVLVDR